jgi:HlyD family secretion protein
VRLVEPSAFTRLSSLGVEEQRVNVVVDIDDPYEKWAALGDGYRVETKTTVYEAGNTLKVPTSALFRHDGEWAAFVVEGGRTHIRRVTILERSAFETQIVDGLSATDTVVVHPSDRVAEGDSERRR